MNNINKLGASLLILTTLLSGMSILPAHARRRTTMRPSDREDNPFPNGRLIESTADRRLMHETAYIAALEWYGRHYGAYPKTKPNLIKASIFKKTANRRKQERANDIAKRSTIIRRLANAHELQLLALSSLRQEKPALFFALADRRVIDKWQLFQNMAHVSGSVPHVTKSIQCSNAVIDQTMFGMQTLLALYMVNDHPDAFAKDIKSMDTEKTAKVRAIRNVYEKYAKSLTRHPAPTSLRPAP